MMRSIVCGASWVWSVAKTRWPVSAAVSAVPIVSMSRISPTRITSGSWRSAAFRASAKDGASAPSSRWLTMQRLCECRNSIGSSIVMMCSSRVSLISLISEASVVDLPEPVGPVTSTIPRGFLANAADDRRQAERLDRHRLGRDQAEGGADGAALEVGVDAVAADAGDRVGEVELPVGLEALALRRVEDRVDELARVGRRQRRHGRRSGPASRARAAWAATPAVMCRSDALFLTTARRSSEKSRLTSLYIGTQRRQLNGVRTPASACRRRGRSRRSRSGRGGPSRGRPRAGASCPRGRPRGRSSRRARGPRRARGSCRRPT